MQPKELEERKQLEGCTGRQHVSWCRLDGERVKTRAVVGVSDKIPEEQRGWTCWICKKGLPSELGRRQRDASAKAHLEQEHPGMNLNNGKREYSKTNIGMREGLAKGRVAHVKKMDGARHKLAAQKGHEITKEVGDLMGYNEFERKGKVFTCKKCRKVGGANRGVSFLKKKV